MILAKKFRTMSRIAAVLTLLFAVGCSREEKPSLPVVPKNRLHEPVLRDELKKDLASQNSVAARRAAIVAQMDEIKKRSAHPEADPKWQELDAARVACDAEMKGKLDAARAKVRAAMMQGVADKAAVQTGRATYAASAEAEAKDSK